MGSKKSSEKIDLKVKFILIQIFFEIPVYQESSSISRKKNVLRKRIYAWVSLTFYLQINLPLNSTFRDNFQTLSYMMNRSCDVSS